MVNHCIVTNNPNSTSGVSLQGIMQKTVNILFYIHDQINGAIGVDSFMFILIIIVVVVEYYISLNKCLIWLLTYNCELKHNFTTKYIYYLLAGKTIDRWVIGGLVGRGGFGNVYLATCVEHGLIINGAVKFIKIEQNNDERLIQNEISSKIKQENVIKLLPHSTNISNMINDVPQAMLVFVYMKHGNLDQYLKSNNKFDTIM